MVVVRHAIPKEDSMHMGIAEKLGREGTVHHLRLPLFDDPVAALNETNLAVLVRCTSGQLYVDLRLLTELLDRCSEELVVRPNNLDRAVLSQDEVPKLTNWKNEVIG
jgi:hypothetical protein